MRWQHLNKKLKESLIEIKEQIADIYYKKGYQDALKTMQEKSKNKQDYYNQGYEDGFAKAKSFFSMTESHNDYYDDCF